MARNLELKLKMTDHKEVIKLLRKNKAKRTAVLNQKDTYYKIKDGLLKLRRVNGKYELIKYLRNENDGNRWSDYEVLLLEGKAPEKYLSELFEIDLIVEKKRILYLYKGTRIHLDTVKNLGLFLELETVVQKGLRDAEKRFNEVVSFLKLDLNQQIKASYKNLLENK